ncbi:Zinc finger CCCH domain-containing protein 18 [Bienertia sinuspersici]
MGSSYPNYEMDLVEATKVLLNRIKNLEPHIAGKVLGAILMVNGERDVIRYACAPDLYLKNLVNNTKLQLELQPELLSNSSVSASPTPSIPINPAPVSDVSLNYLPFSPNGSRLYSSMNNVRAQTPYWDLQQPLAPETQSILSSTYSSYADSVSEDFCLQNQGQTFGFDDLLDPMNGGFPGNHRSASLSDLPLKTCHYFSKGCCRHGSNCRYIHGPDNSLSTVFSPNELGADDHIFSPGALEKLDREISELLKSRRGNPVSIASLPMLYHEMYRKTLQADGAHGQHDVILAEDALKYSLDNRNERNDPGQIVSGSRQIYLTFPPESTFTEEDVSDYFGSNFGAVEDVRIPCQQKRMFGFVTFGSADAVKAALAKGNPHYVCGSRVLVKPYREKSKPIDRKYMDKNDHGMYNPGNYLELEHDFLPMPRCEAPRFRRQLIKEQEQDLELHRHLSQLQLERKSIFTRHMAGYGNGNGNGNGNGIGNGMEELYALDVHSKIPNAEQYYMMDAFNNCTISDDRSNHLRSDYTDNESQLNLPESPFAPSTMGNSISKLI